MDALIKRISLNNKYIQLKVHDDIDEALEWISYDRFDDIKYVEKIGIYRANWIDGYILYRDIENKNWRRFNNIYVTLKSLNNPNNITSEFMNEINRTYKTYGITQDPRTKKYMMVLNDECIKCKNACIAIRFRRNFGNWTSGNDDIDEYIQYTQLVVHKDSEILHALEWIPYDRFYDIKYITQVGVYRANWIDGNISDWDGYNRKWKRCQNMFVILKSLNNSNNITSEFMNKIDRTYKTYGITQDPRTKKYIMVLSDKCTKCGYACNAIHFQHGFGNWTSNNNVIDKLIQGTQLSVHYQYEISSALEWIPYHKFNKIRYIEDGRFGKVYKANWIDGNMSDWDNDNQNWKRKYQNMFVILRSLNNPNNITSEFLNETKGTFVTYGITQDPQTKKYMMVLNDKCPKCNCVCIAIHFQQNFESWTSGNDDIDEYIQYTQLVVHKDSEILHALEWIPYDRFYDVEYITQVGVYRANWIDGSMSDWDDDNQNWKRKYQSMFVILRSLSNPNNITSEFLNETKGTFVTYGITQDPLTKKYMMVSSDKCPKCNCVCIAIHFQQNFESWTSEWIPYDRFYNIKYIAKGGFGKVYKANWADGCIWDWNNETQNWERYGKNMFVALKSLNNSKDVTFEFINEITSHHKVRNDTIIRFYGITQDPETENYMMVLEYANNGSLRNYLNINCNKLSWERKIRDLCDVAKGLESIHNNRLIHRDLHVGNILMVISELPPYHDMIHDQYLSIKICQGLRPRFSIKVPQLIVHLIKRCLDANPLNRPTALEISEILNPWSLSNELREQIKEAEKANDDLPTGNTSSTSLGLSYEKHSGAVYTSRLLNFDNLPKPKNSDDYYEKNDNIISLEFSDSLQINIS
ncbi:kinase-like domain-containing protein [Rhizophagus clarus]|uniref:Kinase-like domain-containing protein n=1 Tax=Rhizophagus clarus TaxID=94130 RepID=A0A8H3M8C1_9GLOM|nr:kinase-like domain-containing protein [Rhizophagus clarus]